MASRIPTVVLLSGSRSRAGKGERAARNSWNHDPDRDFPSMTTKRILDRQYSPDETRHLINEYRANAARMRAIANSTRSPETKAQFEQLARELDHLADQGEALATGDRSRT